MFDTSFTAQGNSSTASISGTPSGTGEIAIAAICVGGGNTITGVPTGWNLLYRSPNTFGASEQLYYKILLGSGSVSASVGLSASSPWAMSLSFFNFGGFVGANVTQVQVNGANVVTVTCANNFAPGNIVLMQSLTNATFLNGQILLVLSATSSQFTAGFTHAAYGPTSDTGTAIQTILQVSNESQGGASSPNARPFNNNVQANSIFASLLYSTQSGTIAFTGGSDTNSNTYSVVSSSEANATALAAYSSPNTTGGNMPTVTVTFSPSFIGNTDIYLLELPAGFGVSPTVPVPAPEVGNPIQFFGVSPSNPAIINTTSNSQQLFTFDSTSRPGIPSLFRYADDANFLGRTAMPGQLLVLPGNGWFRGSQYYVCASGTVTIPASASGGGVSFTLYSNKFVNLAQSGLNIQITSDVLATLSNTPMTPNSYEWSLVAPISGGFGPITSTLNCVGTWNLNGTPSSGSGSSSISNGVTGPKAQLSLGVTFSGTVSGSDQFSSTCSQFEIQEI